MSVNKFQAPGNYPKERIQHSEHGENLKSRKIVFVMKNLVSVSSAAISGF